MSLPRFSVRNPVPVNIIMVAILVFGAWSALTLRREFFPDIAPDRASISLPYPGASPEEVEESLARKVEDAVSELKEVDEIRTNLVEGGGSIMVTFREEITDIDAAVDEVERAVLALQDLPEDAERLQVTKIDNQLPVIMLEIYGEADEEVLKQAARAARDELRSLPGMGQLAFGGGIRNYEIRVEVDRDAMVRYGIPLPSVSSAVSLWMREIPGGSIQTSGGTIGIRTMGVTEESESIRDIVIVAEPDGDVVRLGDIARVYRSFVDRPMSVRFNRAPSVSLTALRAGKQDIVKMARMVRAYVDGRNSEPLTMSTVDMMINPDVKKAWDLGSNSTHVLPPGIQMTTFTDLARFVEGRLGLLTENAIYGAVLVFLTLMVFLNWRAAFWVGMGLVIAFSGTLILMEWTGTTLNLLTMFGLIVVIGLLVDDAIVVCESIQARHDQGLGGLEAAIDGASRVQWPVVATVLTSIVAFLPLTFIKGRIGDMMGALPIVVSLALFMSLIECLMMLPGHMGHGLARRDRNGASTRKEGRLRRFERKRDHLIFQRIVPRYVGVLSTMLQYRYLTLAVSVAVLLFSLAFMVGGRVGYNFLPSDDAESVMVKFEMPIGTPLEHTKAVALRVEDALHEQPEVKVVNTIVGASSNMESGRVSSSTNVGQIFLELTPAEVRDRNAATIMTDVRASLEGRLPGVESFTVEELSGGPGGKDITVYISGQDMDRMMALSERMKNDLAIYEGVFDISDDLFDGQHELQIRLRPSGAALGLTVADIARQVRASVYGDEAHVFAADGEDIDVRVSAEGLSRADLSAIESMWVISPDGRSIPLAEVVELSDGSGYAGIRRRNRSRAMTVTAETAEGLSPELVMASLPIDDWIKSYPDLDISLGGRQESQSRAFASLPLGYMAALGMIYGILAWLFRSYTLPLTVMLGIPFAIIGVIWGHILLGYELTFLSIIGFVALSGIVVNDSLILVHFYQDERDKGVSLDTALLRAGAERLRPIFLTTVTTVLGLTPLMLEQSFQARFLIPMAIAISFGLMSATVLILLLLPCLIMILDDIKRGCFYLWNGVPRPEGGGEDSHGEGLSPEACTTQTS
ncbi:MAG: efflux RND transporter permease subunit [Phycisphaerales bacterium]|nr:efflux RND transporter permease subunit [Phycisphaerales bacterium]